jgi:hypothetical protein
VLRLSAALLSLTIVGSARAQAPPSVGRQLEGQVLNNVGNAVAGQPAAVAPAQPGAPLPGQPGTVVPGQPAGVGVPATPRQALQGIERQAINNATNAATGQPGTMTPQATPAVRYQLPPQYAASAPGTTVTYGGATYVVNADRTMSPAAAATQPATAQPGATQPAAMQPSPAAARYLIPADLAGKRAGSTVSYGGANYLINNDNTMSPAAR